MSRPPRSFLEVAPKTCPGTRLSRRACGGSNEQDTPAWCVIAPPGSRGEERASARAQDRQIGRNERSRFIQIDPQLCLPFFNRSLAFEPLAAHAGANRKVTRASQSLIFSALERCHVCSTQLEPLTVCSSMRKTPVPIRLYARRVIGPN